MLAWVLIGLGLRNLSMAPRQIPVVKSIVRATRRRRGGTVAGAGADHVDGDRDRGAGLRRDEEALPAGAQRRRRGTANRVTAVAAIRVRRARREDWPAARVLLREIDDLHAAIAPEYFRTAARAESEWLRLLEEDATRGVRRRAAASGRAPSPCWWRASTTRPTTPRWCRADASTSRRWWSSSRHRRHGIGRRLMSEARAWGRGHGAAELVLTTWVGNREAEAFYERLGYRELSRVLHRAEPRASARAQADAAGGVGGGGGFAAGPEQVEQRRARAASTRARGRCRRRGRTARWRRGRPGCPG